MKKYMGYRAAGDPAASKNNADDVERQLPVFKIEGTDFIVDIKKHEFRQQDNPYNRITLGNVKEEMGFSHFLYDKQTKNLYTGPPDQIPQHVSIIIVPPLKDLDPVGLAQRQGIDPKMYSNRLREDQTLTMFSRTNALRQKTQEKQTGNTKQNREQDRKRKRMGI